MDAPEADSHCHYSTTTRYEIGHLVAIEPIRAVQCAVIDYMAVIVIDPTIISVEDVSANDRREDDKAPVKTEAGNTKSVRYESGIHAEESAIGETSKNSYDR